MICVVFLSVHAQVKLPQVAVRIDVGEDEQKLVRLVCVPHEDASVAVPRHTTSQAG